MKGNTGWWLDCPGFLGTHHPSCLWPESRSWPRLSLYHLLGERDGQEAELWTVCSLHSPYFTVGSLPGLSLPHTGTWIPSFH